MTNTVDARGMACPIPVVKANQALAQMNEGVLEVHVDNSVAVENLKRMALQKGLPVKTEQPEADHYVVTIPVTGAVDTTMPEITCTDCGTNTVIAVDTDIMGRGNDELGAVLIKGFLFAVSRLETLPKTILFYNGGAKLTTEDSASLEDLRLMEQQGVEILTCGTCLNYYGLTEKLAVGSVTDMYTIVERLSRAEKVIKP
ncbi:MAG: sulfurtransferase-like selenium metabolism protein YedF [Oscillospiraceae bacterium]|nr:sulfurtransferase-like selenium metabolism protein YedF [Oscillospiraceae bacterium]